MSPDSILSLTIFCSFWTGLYTWGMPPSHHKVASFSGVELFVCVGCFGLPDFLVQQGIL